MKPKNLFKQLLPSLRGRVRVGLSPLHLIGGRLLLAMMLAIVGVTRSMAQEAYAVYTRNNTTLTFYYDSQRSTHTLQTESVYDLNTGDNEPDWRTWRASVTNVVFDASFDDARPTSALRWFSDMTNLTSITGIEYFHTDNITCMYYMFANCSSLTSLDVSGWNTGNVTDMKGLFVDCKSLTSLDVSGWNTRNVTDMNTIFAGCSSLTSLDVSEWNTESLTNTFQLFSGCSSLTSLDLSGWNTEKVTSMGYMFKGCSNLVTIIVGDGWNTDKVDDTPFGMFIDCINLVGGQGTKYDANNVYLSYAHVDEGEDNPGYLTYYLSDGAEPYAVLSSDKTTLTFYYDNQRQSRQGTQYTIDPVIVPGWAVNKETITTVEFHELFANYHGLTSTMGMFAD